ncbi:MAG TPA: O-antigen ligase family protein [Anaerolineae bacterium]|nr:O-antigen ligase family protein [Anaerolineae bacterium]
MDRTSSTPSVFRSPDARVSVAGVLLLAALLSLIGGLLVALLGGPISLGLLAGLGFGAWMLRDIDAGYLALIASVCLLPFGALPLPIGFKPTFLDLIMLVLFVVWLTQRVTGKQGKLVTAPVGLPVLIFLALALAAFIAGLGHAPLTQTIARHFAEILLSVVLFFMVVDTVRDETRLAKFVRAILIAGFIASIVAIVLYALPDRTTMELLSRLRAFGYPEGPGVLRYIRDDPSLPQRATGTSIDPNVLGGLLTMTLSVSVTQVFGARRVVRRAWAALFTATMALALILTFSRASFAGVGAALLGLGLLRYRKVLPVIAIVAALILVLPQTQDYVSHFFEGVQGEDLATQMRVGEYKDALTLIGRYPIFGVGFTGSPDLDTYIGVSSVYLLMAEEMGLVGLAVFLLVMLTLFAWAGRARSTVRARPALEPLWWGLHTALAGALIGGVLDHYFFNLDFHHSAVFFWLFVGLAAAATRLALEVKREA